MTDAPTTTPPDLTDDDDSTDEVPSRDPETPQRTSVLDLTTEIAPADLIRIDEEEYQLYSYDHLSPDQEATVTATFARFMKTYRRLEVAKNDAAATALALKLRTYRERLIELMTDVPHDLVKRLGSGKQGQLLTAIQNEIGAEVDTEDDDDEDDIA